MKKEEIIKLLCKKYEYTPVELADYDLPGLRKLLSEEMREKKYSKVDDYPNGRDYDAEDEETL